MPRSHRFAVLALLGACAPIDAPVPPADGAPASAPAPNDVPDLLDADGILHLATPDGLLTLHWVEHDGRALAQGDIDLGPVQDARRQSVVLSPRQEALRDALDADVRPVGTYATSTSARWSNSTIPYDLSRTSIPTTFLAAVAHIEAATNLRFVPRTTEADYLIVADENDPNSCGTSSIGRRGGGQWIELGTGWGCGTGSAIHELGHAAGLYHEHTRSDRNSYVTVHTDCILPGYEHNFSISSWFSSPHGPYDYASIMHYSAWAFADGCQTITPVGGQSIGQRSALSSGDIAVIQAMYPNPPAPVVPPDRLEPNDTSPTAARVSGPEPGLSIPTGDVDWFVVAVPAYGTLTASVAFSHAESDLSLTAYGLRGSPSSNTATDVETVVYSAGPTPEDVTLRVQLERDAGTDRSNPYDLSVGIALPTPGCEPDASEPNDTLGTARGLTAPIPGLRVCTENEDWFQVTVPADHRVDVRAAHDPGEGALTLELYDDAASPPIATGSPDAAGTGLTALPSTPSVWVRVALDADAGAPGLEYTLAATLTRAVCADDRFEPDGPAAPVVLPNGRTSRTACGDDDWFDLDLARGQEATVTLGYDPADGTLTLETTDPTGQPGPRLTGTGSLTVDTAEASRWTARLVRDADLGPDAGLSYTLDVARSASTCPDDPGEPDDTEAEAFPLVPGRTDGRFACANDADVYTLDLAADTWVQLDASVIPGDGHIQVWVFDPAGVAYATGTSADAPMITVGARGAGRHTFQVTRLLGTDHGAPGVAYALDATLFTPGAPCRDDDPGTDDTLAGARDLETGTFTDLRACPARPDWSTIYLFEGDRFVADIDVDPADGAPRARLVEVDDQGAVTLVADGVPTPTGARVDGVATHEGWHHLEVALATDAGASGMTYDRTVSVVDGAPGAFDLELGALVPGGTVTLLVAGAPPSSPLYVLGGTPGRGPCLGVTCLGVRLPVVLASATTSPSGSVRLVPSVPPLPEGLRLGLQAVLLGPSPLLSDVEVRTVQPPGP